MRKIPLEDYRSKYDYGGNKRVGAVGEIFREDFTPEADAWREFMNLENMSDEMRRARYESWRDITAALRPVVNRIQKNIANGKYRAPYDKYFLSSDLISEVVVKDGNEDIYTHRDLLLVEISVPVDRGIWGHHRKKGLLTMSWHVSKLAVINPKPKRLKEICPNCGHMQNPPSRSGYGLDYPPPATRPGQ